MQGFLQLRWARVALNLGCCADMAEVASHSCCVCNIIQAELPDPRAVLEQQAQRLPNATRCSKYGHLGLHRCHTSVITTCTLVCATCTAVGVHSSTQASPTAAYTLLRHRQAGNAPQYASHGPFSRSVIALLARGSRLAKSCRKFTIARVLQRIR